MRLSPGVIPKPHFMLMASAIFTQKLSAFFILKEVFMLTSIAFILLSGLIMGWIFSKLRLPALLGMMIVGIIMSPHCLDLISPTLLDISADIRQIALVIILTRAGLSLNISDLKKIGRPAVLMSFLPACIEMAAVVIFSPLLLGVSYLDAAIIGSIIAAVSPAVIVPRMIKLIDEGYGCKKRIPQLILAGASVDDVFVIVVFYAFTALASTGKMTFSDILNIPVAIFTGIVLGYIVGIIMVKFFKKFHIRDTLKVLILLSISLLLLQVETMLKGIVPLSALLAIMSMAIMINQKYDILARRLSSKYNKLWLGAEIFLFVLVGAAVNLEYAISAGIAVLALIILSVIFRMLGVALSLCGTELTSGERAFCMAAYTPKATVQAAIGTIPLSMGLSCGTAALTAAVVSILITAPFGAICIDNLYKRLLEK